MRGAAATVERLGRQQRDDNRVAGYGCACKASAQELDQLAAVTVTAEGQPMITKPQADTTASISTRTAAKLMSTFKGNDSNNFNKSSSSSSNNNNGNDLQRFISNSPQLLPPKLALKPTQTQTTVGRNSLESINSKFSISSANDDSQQQLQSQSRPDSRLSPLSSSPAPQSPLLIEQSLDIKRQKQQPELQQQCWRNSLASSASTSSSSGSPPAYCRQAGATVDGDGLASAESTLVVSSLEDSARSNSQTTTKQPSVLLRASHSVAVRYFEPPSVPSSKEDDGCLETRSELDQSKGGDRLVAKMEQGQQQQQQRQRRQQQQIQKVDAPTKVTTITQCKSAIAPDRQRETGAGQHDQQSPTGQRLAASKSAKLAAPPSPAPAQQMIALAEKSLEAGEAFPPTGPAGAIDASSINVPTSAEAAPAGPPFVFAGIAASIAASVFFSISILCIKLLPDSEGFTEKAKALFFRGLFMMIFCGATIFTTKGTFIVHRDELWVNVARACLGTTGVFGSYCALKYISMGDSTALVFSSPIWTSILSHFILHEPLQWLQILALPVSLFGIVLIAHPTLIVSADLLSPVINQPTVGHRQTLLANVTALPLVVASHLSNDSSSFDRDQQLELSQATNIGGILQATVSNEPSFDFEHRWPGIVIALLTSLIVSCTYIVLKFRKKTPIQTTTFWLGLTMFVAALAIMSVIGFGNFPPSTWWEWSLLLGNGVCSWIGQTLLQWALLHEEAGILSIVRTLDVAMTFILSALFLDDDIYWTSIVGATIIGLVVASIMLGSWIRNLSFGCLSSHRKQEFSFNDNSSLSAGSCNDHPVRKSQEKHRTSTKTKKEAQKYSQSTRGGSHAIIGAQYAPKTISSLAPSNKQQQQQHDCLDCEPHYVKA